MRSDNDNTTLLGGNTKRFSLRQKLLMIIGAAVVIAAIVIGVSVALYYHSKDKGAGLEETVTVGNIMTHLQALNSLADEQGNGSRSVMHAYDASADYIMRQLNSRNDFCDIQTQQFYVPIYVQLAAPTLGQVSPLNVSYVLGKDFSGTRYGGNGTYDITASTVVVANYGCNMSDFQGNLNLQIAVIFDGNCTQYQKALNAEQANASAVLIVNGKGNSLANWRVRSLGWNSSNALVQVPVLGLTYSLGLTLQEQPGTILHLTTSTQVTIESTFNVLCLTKKGSDNNILVMGSHLDSVPEGPGINDNASGSSSVLEIALEIEKRKLHLKSKILFAWWGAEEIGLLGSRHFVSQVVAQSQPGYTLPSTFDQANFLPSLSTANILLNLNFDMLGSPNFVRQVYNSSAQTPRVNDASFRIQQLFEDYFNSQTTAYQIVPMSGGSDYLPFIENGIPAGALATGAGALKTVEERDTFGGLANAALDPCYHLSCDTIANIHQGVLSDMAKAAAYVVQHLSSQENLNTFLYN